MFSRLYFAARKCLLNRGISNKRTVVLKRTESFHRNFELILSIVDKTAGGYSFEQFSNFIHYI